MRTPRLITSCIKNLNFVMLINQYKERNIQDKIESPTPTDIKISSHLYEHQLLLKYEVKQQYDSYQLVHPNWTLRRRELAWYLRINRVKVKRTVFFSFFVQSFSGNYIQLQYQKKKKFIQLSSPRSGLISVFFWLIKLFEGARELMPRIQAGKIGWKQYVSFY